MEEALKTCAEGVALGLEGISILVIAMGGAEAAYRSFRPMLRGPITPW